MTGSHGCYDRCHLEHGILLLPKMIHEAECYCDLQPHVIVKELIQF